MNALKRHNVKVHSKGAKAMIFAHGYGCDQNVWRYVAPAFEDAYQVIVFDHVGAGASDLNAYHPAKYNSLKAYAKDVLEICHDLEVKDAIFVGHSVSAMIGVLASLEEPGRFEKLVLIGPSPCYINDEDYVGGFSRDDINELLETLASNYLGWSSTMAPVIMGQPDRPELGIELANSFCQMKPEIAEQFARVTFLSDNRKDLAKVEAPALIMQCSRDVIAPLAVGQYLHRNLRKSELVVMKATGHCPILSAPEETIALMKKYLAAGSSGL